MALRTGLRAAAGLRKAPAGTGCASFAAHRAWLGVSIVYPATTHRQPGSRGVDFRRQMRFWVGWRRRRGRNEDRGGASQPALSANTAASREPAATTPTLVEHVTHSVDQSEMIVERQRELVFHLRRNGLPSEDAEKLLRTFQETLIEHRKYLALVQNRQRRG